MFAKTVRKTLSTLCVLHHAFGDPSVVSASMQMLPPAVTWPVYHLKRGETHRSEKGVVG
jgi:hypothetical protein